MRAICAASCAALFLFLTAAGGAAEDVSLVSRDGAFRLAGRLLDFDGAFYRIETIYGEMTVDASGVACEGAACPKAGEHTTRIAISGSASMGTLLLPALVEAFAARAGYTVTRRDDDPTHFSLLLNAASSGAEIAQFAFRLTTSDEGFADLLAGEADFVMSRRAVHPEERAWAREAGLGDLAEPNRVQVLALDALVPVVSPRNALRNISPPELARVLTGGITNWRDLGGEAAGIVVHVPARARDAAENARGLLLGADASALAPRAIRHEADQALAATVSIDPFAFGLSGLEGIGDARPVTILDGCGRGNTATRSSVKSGDYPFVTPQYLYTPMRRMPDIARDLLRFLATAEAQEVIRRGGAVDQLPEEVGIDAQGQRLANAIANVGKDVSFGDMQAMVNALSGMVRLTTTFRFEPESGRLDPPSRWSLRHLADRLARGDLAADRIVLVGFSDGAPPGSDSMARALQDAQEVRDALALAAGPLANGSYSPEVLAFGEALPIACDDAAWGPRINRRVEVWLR